ncbi:hypothetical protein AAHC03_010272 [Spirometra sp. Aus1]
MNKDTHARNAQAVWPACCRAAMRPPGGFECESGTLVTVTVSAPSQARLLSLSEKGRWDSRSQSLNSLTRDIIPRSANTKVSIGCKPVPILRVQTKATIDFENGTSNFPNL